MDNRPGGRQKNITGQGKDIGRRGSIGGGPAGRSDGYSDRQSSMNRPSSRPGRQNSAGRVQNNGGGVQRSGGRPGILTIIIAAAVLLFGGKFGFDSLFSDDFGTSGTGALQSMTSVLGSSVFDGGGSVSTGWSSSPNGGKLDSSVAANARSKYTGILGGGKDTVTVMVYLCGTDLESKNGMATADLQEMVKADIGSNVNLLVYTGGCKKWQNNIISNKVNQIYKVENGSLKCLVKDDGSAAMTSPATLTRYIRYCTQNYPANRYELIMWDHGGGSLSGYGYDEKNMSSGSMTLKGINEALAAADTKFDFIGFDACLMATLENALMLNNYADYLIASEETEPGIGWYYTNWLSKLSGNTSMDTIEIGKYIADDFVSECARRCGGQKTTLSVIDLSELSQTVPEKLSDFSASTSSLLENNGYATVSNARSSTREFSSSSKIDQVDLVHLAYNIDTAEGRALADALLSAIKYNKTSSAMTNAYGLSIYFPYRKTSAVSNAVSAYNAIGIDSGYTRCIQQFASMEISGQAVTSGSSTSPLGTLLSGYSGTNYTSTVNIGDILSGLLGGELYGLDGLTSSNTGFLGRYLDTDLAADFIEDNRFDTAPLEWTRNGEQYVLSLSEDEWSLVHDLQLNVFLDDGDGYIDLGLDNVYDFTDNGDLIGGYDETWLAIDSQPVAYYYVDSVYDGDNYSITGRVPVLLNGDRANLILVFDNDNPYGYIAGARSDYINGETDTIAKGMTELQEGDKIEFVCDFYSYDGKYQDSYVFGDPLTYTGGHEISNVYIDSGETIASYMFTDIYCQEYWTPQIP